MELGDLIDVVGGFYNKTQKEKITLCCWWLQTHGGKDLFTTADVRDCFNKLQEYEPTALSTYMTRLANDGVLWPEKKGKYKLGRPIKGRLDKEYGLHHSVIAVSKILSELPEKVPNIAERAFLNEALQCYRHEAYRSCIVMMWNLAYAHLLDWILAEPTRLTAFNQAITKKYPKKTGLTVAKYDDFTDELKEREVIEIGNVANLFNSNIFKILKDKLDRRNIVAHPSTVVVVQSQADDTVTDLANNVVLALN
jgi:hypothetical protein